MIVEFTPAPYYVAVVESLAAEKIDIVLALLEQGLCK